MPRKPKVTYKEIFDAVIDLPIFEERSLKKERNPVWIEACKNLQNRVSTHYIYIYIYENRKKIQHNLLLAKFGEPSQVEHDVDSNDNCAEIEKGDDYEDLHRAAFSVEYNHIVQKIGFR